MRLYEIISYVHGVRDVDDAKIINIIVYGGQEFDFKGLAACRIPSVHILFASRGERCAVGRLRSTDPLRYIVILY